MLWLHLKQQQAHAGLQHESKPMLEQLASSPEWLVFVVALALLGFLYSLMLFVKNRYLEQLEERPEKPVCGQCRNSRLPTCRAIYNCLFLHRRRLAARACCGRCGARLESQTGRARRKGFKGLQQPAASCGLADSQGGPCEHPIIFSKSRDSILVPELAGAAELAHQHSHASTTRVLTDANGHSIKIRLASPPPQRQSQLAALHQSLCANQPTTCWTTTATPPPSPTHHHHHRQQLNRASFASQSSESPLISGPPGGPEQAASVAPPHSRAPQPPPASSVAASSSSSSSSSRSASEAGSSAGHTLGGEPSSESSRQTEPVSRTHNHSNSSDFDGPSWDSRQDSSLEQAPMANTGAHQQVLDADLRHANKLNMELVMMHNVASSPKPARSKSSQLAAASQCFGEPGASSNSAPGSSRRSSCASASLSRPSLRVLVRPLARAKDEAPDAAARRSPGLLATLSALGRSGSTGSGSCSGSEESSSTAGSCTASGAPADQLYELRPLEVHNLATKAVTKSRSQDKESAGRTLSAGRRASLNGLTVRLFKRQGDGQEEEHTGTDYQELPVVRLGPAPEPDGDQQQQQQPLELTKLADEPQSYAFLCRRDEFPIRLSLYLVGRRTGARLTVGHCFMEPSDWSVERRLSIMNRTSSLATERGTGSKTPPTDCPALGKRLSSESSSAGSSSGELPAERSRLVTLDTGSGLAQLEYRLHQTILEAIK